MTKIPVGILADTSASMQQDGRIEAVNNGLEQLRENLAADTLVSLQTDVCVIGFNHELGYQDFRSGRDFQAAQILCGGRNSVCAGHPFLF